MRFEQKNGIKLLNHSTGISLIDVLHNKQKSIEGPCEKKAVCLGSRMIPEIALSNKIKTKKEVLQQAKEFFDEYFKDHKGYESKAHVKRWKQVEEEILAKSIYTLTYEELVYGTRLAWRNAPRCIARMLWSNLKVFDARHVRTAKEMFECIIEHITYATNGGQLRATITIFPPRTDGFHDFRIWNSQLVGYAGYRNSDGSVTGDPANVIIAQKCIELGWKPKRTSFDVLPLILQANGGDPEYFEIPEDLVLQVPLSHPNFEWFESLKLKWYALPAVANMLFDCGGIQFPAAPFNGWYMGTEIGSRDLCDTNRYNMSETIARKMGLDTSSSRSLWKDTVVLEVNKAVLHSFQKSRVTIWDHHTASESFSQFFASENKTRGGCPADWVWLVPPLSSSMSPLFHQEMAFYFLKPSYEYQIAPWKEINRRQNEMKEGIERTISNHKFRVLVNAVIFSTHLWKKCWQARPKLVVLYASESGKALKYARETSITLNQLFQVHFFSMAEFQVADLWLYQAVIVIVSTFGDGEAPTHARKFKDDIGKYYRDVSRTRSNNVTHFAVLGLGSSLYPKFCAFGIFMHDTLSKLGAVELHPLVCADEMKNQDIVYSTWLEDTTSALCTNLSSEVLNSTRPSVTSRVFDNSSLGYLIERPVSLNANLTHVLGAVHQKKVSLVRVLGKKFVTSSSRNTVNKILNGETVLIRLGTYGSPDLNYQPGDHLCVFPRNPDSLVHSLMLRLQNKPAANQTVQFETLHGSFSWNNCSVVPPTTFYLFLSRVVDLAGPPSQTLLKVLAERTKDSFEKNIIQSYAEDSERYQEWICQYKPNVVDIMNSFRSIQIDAAELVKALPLLKPRYYSISSSILVSPLEIHITASLVKFKLNHNEYRKGLCSAYLEDVKVGDFVACCVRSCPSFHLPKNSSSTVICIGAGSGIAPFRGFWWERYHELMSNSERQSERPITSYGKIKNILAQKKSTHPQSGSLVLIYGCKTASDNIYADEVNEMAKLGVIKKQFLAFSREPRRPKAYVQDVILQNGSFIYKQVTKHQAHIFVCGAINMAADVENALKDVFMNHGLLNDQQAAFLLNELNSQGRYLRDVYSY